MTIKYSYDQFNEDMSILKIVTHLVSLGYTIIESNKCCGVITLKVKER